MLALVEGVLVALGVVAGGVVVVPTQSIDASFVFQEMTRAYQMVAIQGQFTYRIVAPQHTADADQAREAVRTLAALRPDTIVFGHGPSIAGGAAEQLDQLLGG